MIAFAHQRLLFAHHLFGTKPGAVLGGGEPAQLQQLHHLVGHQAQKGLLGVVQMRGL